MSAFTDDMLKSMANVERTRAARLNSTPERFTAEEKEALLQAFHPDYSTKGFKVLEVGPNKGEKAPVELAQLLEGKSLLQGVTVDLERVDYDVDVLIIGGGGAGAAAAIEAKRAGADVMIVTKLRMGDANTMMAEGGIQGADKGNDSPAIHYLDALGGGHYKNIPELLEKLVTEGPLAIDWLDKLGVMFDKEADGTMVTTHGGGTSRKRMHACADYTGAELMRVLRDEVQNCGVKILEFAPAIELLLDEAGKCAGAVLLDYDSNEHIVVRAKTVIMATGGAGRLHYQGFPTSNHYGATADGLVMAYRAGAPLIYEDAIQYHPTGVAYPAQIYGALVTEKVRSLGAQLVNSNGEAFMHPLETRDVSAASIIRECTARGNGVKALDGVALWLDTPMIEIIHGEGTIQKRLPGMLRMYKKFGIDLRKEPILIYPTLHYQNGGILIDANAETKISGLYVAGEAVGGIHGTNRLMGNSLLDIIVFGRIAGIKAAEKAKTVELGKLSLAHVDAFAKETEAAGIASEVPSPKLLPVYTHGRNAR